MAEFDPDASDLGGTMVPAVDGADVRWALPSFSDRMAHPDRVAPTTVQRVVVDRTPAQLELMRVHGFTDDQMDELGGTHSPEAPPEHGRVPESPADYFLQDMVPEADLPLVEPFLAVAHEQRMSERQVRAALDVYYDNERAATEARANEDRRIQQESERALRAEWGERFGANIRGVNSAAARVFGKALAEQVLYGRLADGTPIGSSPAVLRALARLANNS